MLQIQRIADPQLSPDGKTVAFAVSVPDWRRTRASTASGAFRSKAARRARLADRADRPRWSPDGKRIFYVSTISDTSQIWSMNPDGTGIAPVTRLSTEADGEIVSSDGKYIVVTSRVYPDCSKAAPGQPSRIRRRVQQEPSRRRESKQSQSAADHRASLPPLGRMGGKPAQPFAFDIARRRRSRRSDFRRAGCAKSRPFRSAAPTTTRFLPTAGKSASS